MHYVLLRELIPCASLCLRLVEYRVLQAADSFVCTKIWMTRHTVLGPTILHRAFGSPHGSNVYEQRSGYLRPPRMAPPVATMHVAETSRKTNGTTPTSCRAITGSALTSQSHPLWHSGSRKVDSQPMAMRGNAGMGYTCSMSDAGSLLHRVAFISVQRHVPSYPLIRLCGVGRNLLPPSLTNFPRGTGPAIGPRSACCKHEQAGPVSQTGG